MRWVMRWVLGDNRQHLRSECGRFYLPKFNGIALAFARTETAMFRRWVWPHASGVLFLAGRPNFHYPDGARARGNSGGPICLIAYGDDNRRALQKSGLQGALVALVAESAQEDRA